MAVQKLMQVLLMSNEGADQLAHMCSLMGHSLNTGNNYKPYVSMPFKSWKLVPDTHLAHIVLVDGIEVLISRDVILGQFTIAATE